MKKLGFILFFFISTSFSADLITKVIPLNYMNVGEAEQALNPLLSEGETISHTGNQLIVNVSPDTLTKLRSVLHQIDIPPVVFNILVHQDQANWLQTSDNDDVVYGTTTTNDSTGNSQSVQVMSGASALISTGSNVPVVSSVGAGAWNAGVSYERMDVKEGFLVKPQMEGSQVKLMIRRVNSQVDNINAQQIDTQNVNTTTIIPLDKWVKVGSSGQADLSSKPSTDIVYSAGAGYKDKATVYIKVSINH